MVRAGGYCVGDYGFGVDVFRGFGRWMMDFKETEKTDVTKHIEKKGRFSYLSWPFAVSEFRKACPDGWWEIGKQSGVPVISSDCGYFVEVTVFAHDTCHGFTQIHPVLDHKNKPRSAPNSFDINTSIQRCLVKAIALATGIGLHIYAGEDLPPDSTPKPDPKPEPKTEDRTQRDALRKALSDKGMSNAEQGQFAGYYLNMVKAPEMSEAVAQTILEDLDLILSAYKTDKEDT